MKDKKSNGTLCDSSALKLLCAFIFQPRMTRMTRINIAAQPKEIRVIRVIRG